MDTLYLHPKYFTPKKVVFDKENQKKNVILRFVSWGASHDINETGFTDADIVKLIQVLSKEANIYITSEKKLPQELQKYALKIDPAYMHSYMAAADMFISESGSMATEAAFLGTHSIVLNSAAPNFGVFQRLSKYENFYVAQDFDDVLNTSQNLLKKKNLKSIGKSIAPKIIADCINMTDFLVWFIEEYPHSKDIMKDNPDYQNIFI